MPTPRSHSHLARWAPLALVIALTTLVATGGCFDPNIQEDLDSNSGTDRTRQGAEEIALNATIVDNVSTERLDKTDWKYFNVPAPGIVEIIVSFDNPRAYGEMVVTDKVGQIVSTFADEKKALLDRVTFKAETGVYYLQFWANSKGSDYSVLVNYNPI